ncbi:hypothetical protein E4T44_10690 [Aureobasidium sp. EXF-8845]|nr:hypothetical protein E4T44_10690 [Aureobasidium sp. EXF-8845]KAI4817244.1 hypothetical protein E4T45_10591 [Aureobasidium sp. EXF-8846]
MVGLMQLFACGLLSSKIPPPWFPAKPHSTSQPNPLQPANMSSSRTLNLLRSTRLSTPRLSFSPSIHRTFTTSSPLLIKEDANRSPEQLEKIKQDQLKAQEEGKAEWNEELASAGEASITADKEEVNDHGKHMEELQKETAGDMKKEKGE